MGFENLRGYKAGFVPGWNLTYNLPCHIKTSKGYINGYFSSNDIPSGPTIRNGDTVRGTFIAFSKYRELIPKADLVNWTIQDSPRDKVTCIYSQWRAAMVVGHLNTGAMIFRRVVENTGTS